MNPYTQALHDLLQAPLEARRIGEAVPLLKWAIQSGADEPYFLYALGNCQFLAGDYPEAAIALTQATRMDPMRRRHRSARAPA